MFGQKVLSIELYIFLLVLASDWDLFSLGFERVGFDSSPHIFLHSEVKSKHILEIIFFVFEQFL